MVGGERIYAAERGGAGGSSVLCGGYAVCGAFEGGSVAGDEAPEARAIDDFGNAIVSGWGAMLVETPETMVFL